MFAFDGVFSEEFSNNLTIEDALLNRRGDVFKTQRNTRLQLIVGDKDHEQLIKNNRRLHEGFVPQSRGHENSPVEAGTSGGTGYLL